MRIDYERISFYAIALLILVAAVASSYTAYTVTIGQERAYNQGVQTALVTLHNTIEQQQVAQFYVGGKTSYCLSEEVTQKLVESSGQSTISPN